MSTTYIIIISVSVAFIALIVFSYYKTKRLDNSKKSDKILVLDKKNFKPAVSKGLVLVDFWAAWCGPCKMMNPVLNDVAEDKNFKAKVAKVNVEHNQGLASAYKVRSIPTLIVFQNGKEINRFQGFKSKKFLMKEINKIG